MKISPLRHFGLATSMLGLTLIASPLVAKQPGSDYPVYIGVVTDIDENGAFHLFRVEADFYLGGRVFTESFLSNGAATLVGQRVRCRDVNTVLDERDGVKVQCSFVYGEHHGRDIHEYFTEIDAIEFYCEPFPPESPFYLENC